MMTKLISILFVCLFLSILLSAQNMEMSSPKHWVVLNTQAFNRHTGHPAPGVRTYLTIPGPSNQFYSALSDSNGVSRFLICQPSPGVILIISHEEPEVTGRQIQPFVGSYDMKHIKEKSIQQNDSLPFYGTADKRYFLDDYTRFSSLEEVFVEFIPEIKLRKHKEDFSMDLMNAPYQTFFNRKPLMLLDGVPVFDLNKLMAVNPLNLKTIEVVERKYYYGSLVCYGIVSCITYDGKMGGYQLPENAVVIEYAE